MTLASMHVSFNGFSGMFKIRVQYARSDFTFMDQLKTRAGLKV